MRSDELSDEVADLIDRCQRRIKGVGAEQYSLGDTQKFETLPLDSLFAWAQEEVEDIVNYATMLDIRIRRLRQVINSVTS